MFNARQVSGEPMAAILLDVEKAFDRVSWHFLWALMVKKGIGPNFIRAIKALYVNPTDRVCINGELSEHLTITRGTRQGCCPCPLYYLYYTSTRF